MNTPSEPQEYNFKTPWYFNTCLICILFAAWFLYGIPLIVGIVLLIFKTKHGKKTMPK